MEHSFFRTRLPTHAIYSVLVRCGPRVKEVAGRRGEACLAPLTFASHTYDDFHLLMPLYICRRWEGFVQPLDGQALKWVRPGDLRRYPMPPADAPLIPHLEDLLG